MLNRVILIGRLTRDPELRYTPKGVAVTRFSLAIDRPYTNAQGERETDFINIVTWKKLAENCAQHLYKGSLIGLEGRLQTGKYENNEGRTVYTTDVVADDVRFLEPKSTTQSRKSVSRNGGGEGFMKRDPFVDDGKPIDISDDDLPF